MVDYYKNDFVSAIFYTAVESNSKLIVQTSSGTFTGYPADPSSFDDKIKEAIDRFSSLNDNDGFEITDPDSVIKSITLTKVQRVESDSLTEIPTRNLIIFVSDISGMAFA